MINLDGEAIGINSMKVTPGISFAIPIDYAKEFLQKSQEKEGLYKKKHRRFMGVTMLAITPQTIPQLKQKIGLPQNLEHGIVYSFYSLFCYYSIVGSCSTAISK